MLSAHRDDDSKYLPAICAVLKGRPSTAALPGVAATLFIADSNLTLIVGTNVTMCVILSTVGAQNYGDIDLVWVLIRATVYPGT